VPGLRVRRPRVQSDGAAATELSGAARTEENLLSRVDRMTEPSETEKARALLRVALISPPYGGGSSGSMRPIGLMALLSYLKGEFGERVEVALFDYSDCAAADYKWLDHDRIYDFQVVGFCAYSTNFPIVRSWALELKARSRNVIVVIGGPHATAVPVHLATLHRDAFDIVVRGEGEKPLAAIVASVLRGEPWPAAPGLLHPSAFGDSAVGTTDPVKDLNTVPVPIAHVVSPYEHELVCFDHKEKRFRKAFPFTTSRGCPFSCTFCSIRASDSTWRAVGADRLGDWIAAAKTHDPEIEHINFMDADFLIQKKRVMAIGEMFAARHPEQTWSFSARVDDLARLGEPALQKLVQQGLRAIEVGFESGSQAMLDLLGKRVRVQDNYDAIAMLQRIDLDILIDFILFIPDETPAQLRESLEFLKRANLADYLPHDHLFTSLIQYPATALRRRYERVFERRFSMDELPKPDDLFTDPGTKMIFAYFVREFSSISSRLGDLIEMLRRAVERPERLSDRKTAQYLRIESVSLRQLPILVLESLIDSHEAGTLAGTNSLVQALPWLERFDDHANFLEELCRTTVAA